MCVCVCVLFAHLTIVLGVFRFMGILYLGEEQQVALGVDFGGSGGRFWRLGGRFGESWGSVLGARESFWEAVGSIAGVLGSLWEDGGQKGLGPSRSVASQRAKTMKAFAKFKNLAEKSRETSS